MGIFGKKKSAQPITLAKMDPPEAKVANGRASLPAKARSRATPAPAKTRDKDLAEWMGYLFGDQVRVERISDIPEEAIVHFMVMKLQGRICTLTGGPNDPDLMNELMQDFMELMISRNREGRREMQNTISSRIQAEQDDEPEAWLRGKLN